MPENEFSKKMAERLVEFRALAGGPSLHEVAGRSHEELPEEQRFSVDSLRMWESGTRSPGSDKLLGLAKLYRASPLYLLTGIPPKHWNPGTSERDELAHYMRIVGRWLGRVADSDADLMGVPLEVEDDDALIIAKKKGRAPGARRKEG
jgi:transcriptional regulator with XRE-family HTH domain